MATKTVTQYTDDLDGSTEGVSTVKFGLHGTNYEIDLNAQHQKDLEAALEQFVAVARKAGGSTSTSRRSSGSSGSSASFSTSNARAVRAWASENGVTVPERGRIPKSVLEQYEAAQG